MDDERVRENRLRRMAERQGYALKKSRRRDPRALDYGAWYVIDPLLNVMVAGGNVPGGLSLDDVEAFLTDVEEEEYASAMTGAADETGEEYLRRRFKRT
jgi:hypothetical protein